MIAIIVIYTIAIATIITTSKTIIIAIVILTSTANMMLYLHLTTALSYPTAVTATTSLI